MVVLGGVLLLLAGSGRLLCLHLLMLSLPLPQALGLDAQLLQLASVIGRRADHVSPRLDGAEDEVRRQHLQHRLQVRGHLHRNAAQPVSQSAAVLLLRLAAACQCMACLLADEVERVEQPQAGDRVLPAGCRPVASVVQCVEARAADLSDTEDLPIQLKKPRCVTSLVL